jgi:pimeloyl-ACP methyl ester carboxylesterase
MMKAFLCALVLVFSLPALATASSPAIVAEHGFFYAGGHYAAGPDGGEIMTGQMYVEYFFPKRVTHPYPIVLITGGGSTGLIYEGTPDGRPGWANYYVAHGYKVYVTDQPARGRSISDPKVDGPMVRDTVDSLERRLTIPEHFELWPQAKLHTQWPGRGTPGDPAFDAFIKSRAMSLASQLSMERLNRQAVADLLDRIGPAIIQTHSQSGDYGWVIADVRPKLVKAIVAVEPNGPPFHDVSYVGPPDYFGKETAGRPWGLTAGPITYSPPVSDPSQLTFVQEDQPDGPGLVRCWSQAAPAHQLPTLRGIKILMISSEASYHAPYDHCTSKYLTQAGVKHDWIKLVDRGIRGNGHDMMIEKNNLAIVAVIGGWLSSKGL